MKRIKILLIICVVLLFSGCSINYNIDVNEENPTLCTEELTIKGFDSNKVGVSYNEFVNSIYERVVGSYTIEQSGNNTIVSKNVCNLYDLSNSNILEKYIISSEFSNGYINIVFDEEELGNLIISNNGETLEETGLVINININIPYKVTNTNAKKRDGNTYMWKFDKNNSITNVTIKYDASQKDFKLTSKQLIIISVSSFIALLLIIFIAIFIKHKAVNS